MPLNYVNSRNIVLNTDNNRDDGLNFIILADTQFGLNHRYIEKKPLPYTWDKEIAWLEEGINVINNLINLPDFIIIVGDLTDAPFGNLQLPDQIKDLKLSLAKLNSCIDLCVLPGNHDIDDRPSNESISAYTSHWGDDFYKIQYKDKCLLVVNSQLWYDSSLVEDRRKQQDEWLENELSNNTDRILGVFQHIPFYVDNIDEPHKYFNLPKEVRSYWLKKFYDAGIRYVFTGHLHKNAELVYSPKPTDEPLHIIATSSVGVQLGDDVSGFRACKIDKCGVLGHKYINI